MKVIYLPSEIYAEVHSHRMNGRSVGLIPTMGALHQGHLALVIEAKRHCSITCATIFVNPTQFGPKEDLGKYPRTLEQDLAQLESIGTDLVFVPTSDAIYPQGFSTYVDPPAVAKRWEGEIRPGHFRGVATVVLKLFQMVPADHAFFGKKDYQQLAVIQAMVRDFNLPVEIHPCETVREKDGLAMSSRNRYLSAEERVQSLGLSQALQRAQHAIDAGVRDVDMIQQAMIDELHRHDIQAIDYAVVVDAVHLEPQSKIRGPSVALIAARVGTTRLIDNRVLEGT